MSQYPITSRYINPIPRGATLPQLFKVEGVGICLVKFLENPQGPRALTNELIGFEIANRLGLEHPSTGIVEVDARSLPFEGTLIASNPDIYGQDEFIFGPGLAFYSKWLDPKDEVFASDVSGVGVAVNPGMLAGVVVLDLLLGNTDRKPRNTNLILHRESKRQHLKLIDLSMAFGNANWEVSNLQDTSLPPLTAPLPYSIPPEGLLDTVNPLTDFRPYLAKLEQLDRSALEGIVGQVPAAWGIANIHRATLVNYLYARAQNLPAYLDARAVSKTKKWWQ
jgi:hypothetical protein